MPGFLNPLWLLALVIVPLVYWLHRWRTPLSSWPVSAIFLWDESATSESVDKKKRRPESAWRRRALATALLVIALAAPYLSTQSRSLIIWVDDSLTAFTVEDGNSRLVTMLEILSGELNGNDATWPEITLRSLANPGLSQTYGNSESLRENAWQAGPGPDSGAGSMPVLTSDSEHWLLTDGASPDVRAWAARAPLSHVIQAGIATENVALTRLAARRDVGGEKEIDVLVSVTNTGLGPDARQLEIRSGEILLQTIPLSLSAGQTVHRQSRLRGSNGTITASLIPGDSLVRDDELTIILERFDPLATQVSRNCGPSLWRALATHPALAIVASGIEATLIVDCSREKFAVVADSGAQIRFLQGRSEPLASAPTWLPYTQAPGGLSFSTDWISVAQWPGQAPTSGQRVLLRTTDQPLVVLQESRPGAATVVDTVIDMGHPRFVRQPEYAAFVAALVDLATGRELLDETITVSREALHSVVIPMPVTTLSNTTGPSYRAVTKSLSSAFLIAALFVFLLDAVLLMRSRREARNA